MYCRETDPRSADAELLMIGYGNSLRTDDGVGPAVVQRLSHLLPSQYSGSVEVMSCLQLTPELSSYIASYRRVVFIDASVAMSPGRIAISRIKSEELGAQLGHYFTPGMVLTMAAGVFGASPQAWTAAVGCQSTDIGDQLTPVVIAAVERLARHLFRCVTGLIDTGVFSPEMFEDSNVAVGSD
ncbi:MAG: hydrogenase maturation protease [Phycisphaerae bacterium]